MSSENSPSTRSPKEEPPNGSCFFNASDGLEFEPYLVILEQPQSRFRFRYKSEMTGTHGSLMGESQDKTRKTYPTVKLSGFNDQQAVIRCSLATNESVPLPHVHSLEGDPQGEGADFQDVTVSSLNDYTASFQGITIIHTGKKHVKEVFERRLRHMYLQEALMTDPKIESLSSQSLQQIKEIAESKANSIDLHAVRLKFEALLPSETPGVFHYVCPPIYSNPVCNLKATQTGDLRIVRIDKHVSCVTGNEEVFIFVEKVNKRNIKVKFFEVDEETGSEVWHAFAEFSELDVHHQYAIAFKTPPYKDLDIDSDVDVYLQLYRPQDGATSDPKPFKYKPRDQPRKRARLGVGANESVDSFNHAGSFRTSSQSSVIVSPPSSQSLNKYGSGSSDSASDSPYLSQLRAVYGMQVPIPSRGLPVSQSAVAQKSPQQDSQQLYSTQPGRHYHSLQQVTHQASVANLTSVTSGIATQPTIQNLPSLPPASEGLSLEIEDYLRRIEEQSINPTQVVAKNLQDGSVFNCIPPRVTSLRSVNPQGHFPPSQIGQGLSTVNLEHFLNGRSDPEGLPPNLSDNCNLACDGFPNGYLAVTRGMQNLQIGDTPPPTEEKRIKDFDVAKLVGLSLGTSLRRFAITGNIMPLMVKMNSLVALQDDYGDNALHAALTHYQLEAFKLLLGAVSHRPKPNDVVDATNIKRQTPLHIAVLTNNCDAVKSLLSVGADSDVPDNSGNTALHLAATDRSLAECLVELLNPKNRIDTNAAIALDRNNYTDGYCPLHLAVVSNWAVGVKMLLEAGADPNKKDYRLGKSPLHLAAEANSVDIVNLILKTKRANPNIQAYDGTTPLHLAVLKKNKEICIELLRAGADPHISSFVPVGDQSYYEGSSDTEEEESYVYTQTPLDLAEDIPEISEILTNPPVITEEATETVEEQVENVPESDVLALTSSCSQNGRLDSGIDIDSSSSFLADSAQRGPKDVLDSESIVQLASLFPPQSQNFARLMSDFDFQLFRPVLATKEHPAKYLFSNLPGSRLTPHGASSPLIVNDHASGARRNGGAQSLTRSDEPGIRRCESYLSFSKSENTAFPPVLQVRRNSKNFRNSKIVVNDKEIERGLSREKKGCITHLTNHWQRQRLKVLEMAVEFNRRPFLSIVVQPQSRFRFRYESEMRGTHGMLIGEGEDSVTKRFPSVKLHQFKGREAILRVSLATNEDKPIPHVHSLVAEKGQGKDVDYIDVTVSAGSDYTAIFQGIAIIHRGKKFVHEVLTNRISKMELQNRNRNSYFPAQEELDQTSLNEIQELVKRKAPGIDPHAVKLKFEAFTFDQYGNLIQIAAPVYSKPIFNEKGAQTGTLKIVKIDKAYSTCRGREEIFIFVEKVSKKNIKIRFFELDPATKQENWHAFADFSENDVHHQYAIAFRTPPFRDFNIEDDVHVFMELYRPQDGARSEPRPFTYKPCENPRKRLRHYNDVNGLNDQLAHIFKSIVGESTFPYDSCAKSVRRENEGFLSNRNEKYIPDPKFTLAPPVVSPMTSLSVSPQFSPMGESYCSSFCGSPSNAMVSPQHPHSEVSSVEASPYTPSEMRFDECTPATFSLDDFTDNGHLPDFFELASDGSSVQYGVGLTDQHYGTFDILSDCSIATGGPPRLSSNGLASDSACITAGAVQALGPKQIQQLTDMIGVFSLNDDVTERPSNPKTTLRHKNSLPESSDQSRSKTKLKQLANVGSVFHTVLSVCNEQKIGAMIKLLVSESGQAVFDWKNNDGLTALHVALSYRKMVAVEQLVVAGANVNIADKDGDTVLHIAAVGDELAPILEVLLRGRNKNAALCRRNNQGFTPLHLAVEEGSHKNIELLLKNGANVNLTEHRRGRTPLHVAVEQDCLPSVKSLIELGKQIDVNIESYNGKTALETTTNEEIKTTLIAAGGHLRENPEQDLSDL